MKYLTGKIKRTKITYLLSSLLIAILILIIYLNTNKLVIEYKGYAFYQDADKKISSSSAKRADVIIHVKLKDSNLNNDKIRISYDGIKIDGNIILKNKKDDFWTGKIIHYDNINAEDKILGDIVLFDKGKECFINLYNENLKIVAPVDDLEMAIKKYMDFYIRNSEYKPK